MGSVSGSPSAAAWGILGGTFDPIHLAHLAVAEQTRETLGLAGVLFIPAGVPVHKPDRLVTPVGHRLAMVELAIDENPAFHLSRIEVDRPGPSYTVETLERLHADLGRPSDDPFVLIISVEALAGFLGWREPQRILELARLAVVPRYGYRPMGASWLAEHFPGQHDRVIFLDAPDLGHSASAIRGLSAAGRSVRYLVPDAVARYMTEHRLYPTELWTKN